MATFDISYAAAAAGGLLSFLSPCVLPLVPAYLCFIAGTSFEELTREDAKGEALGSEGLTRRVALGAVGFVLGFSTIFIALGAGASAINPLILGNKDILGRIAGVIIIIFGLHYMGVLRIGFLNREARFRPDHFGDVSQNLWLQFLSPYVLGLAFAFGWTPCIGPQLGAILSLAASEASVVRGTALLAVYAAGLGIPFLLVAAFLPRLTGTMAWMKRNMERIERIMGLLLWTIGLLMLTGGFSAMSYWLLETFPSLAALG